MCTDGVVVLAHNRRLVCHKAPQNIMLLCKMVCFMDIRVGGEESWRLLVGGHKGHQIMHQVIRVEHESAFSLTISRHVSVLDLTELNVDNVYSSICKYLKIYIYLNPTKRMPGYSPGPTIYVQHLRYAPGKQRRNLFKCYVCGCELDNLTTPLSAELLPLE